MAEKLTNKDYEKLGREMWSIYENGYTNRKRMFSMIFLKGTVYGFGIFLGGTLLVALLLYVLSLFDQVTIIDRLYDMLTDPTSVQAPNKSN